MLQIKIGRLISVGIKRSKIIFKRIFQILMLLIGIAILAGTILKMIREKRNEDYIQNYPKEINQYLMDKYGTRFYMNPDYIIYNGGSPIPGKSYTPYIYELREYDKAGAVFNVCVYPESTYQNKIQVIQDNYCWKFFNSKTKEWFEMKWSDIITGNYKLIMFSMYSNDYFDKTDENISPDLPLEDYYENRTFPVSITLQLVLPPAYNLQNMEEIERAIEKTGINFQKEIPNSEIRLSILRAKTKKIYEGIDVRELENSPFYLYKGRVEIGDDANFEIIKEIELLPV